MKTPTPSQYPDRLGPDPLTYRWKPPISSCVDAGYIAGELHFSHGSSWDKPGTFVRIIRNDTTVALRRGARGTFGGIEVTAYPTRAAANEAFLTIWENKVRGGRYEEVYACSEADPLVDSDPRARGLERHFETRWNADITTLVAPTSHPNWMMIQGLLAECERNQGAACLLRAVLATPHAVDYHSDRIVTRCVQFRDLANARAFWVLDPDTDLEGYRWAAAYLCPDTPELAADPLRFAELVLGMLVTRPPSWPRQSELAPLVAAAHHLFALQSK